VRHRVHLRYLCVADAIEASWQISVGGDHVTDLTESSSGIERLRETLAAVARGDSAAFETLYRSTSAKLFGVCLRILPKRSDAEEVLQEVYTTVWRKADAYDAARASPITWLVMIARNKAIDRARAAISERHAEPIDLAADVADTAPPAASVAESDNEWRRLDGCLGELEPQRRRLIRTAFFEGATYDELASRSGVPLGTVKSWIRRSLLKLKACLER
jgi:RNA polymerase sigma-70 factor (ECF subfamily)